MRVLITGSAGRLGRSVTQVLAARGHDVVGVDRQPSGIDGVVELPGDLGDPGFVGSVLAEARPEAVVHLAAIAVPFSAPERDILRVNVQLAYDVLQAAATLGVQRVLCASSPTVLGYTEPSWRPDYLPLDDDHRVAPANAYALSKVAVEELVRMHARSKSVVAGSFRPCYVLSPEEWAGAPTQQGHTVRERLEDPALAAVSLFNYVDARDAGEFVDLWLRAPADAVDGEGFTVGAADALAVAPVAELAPRFAPALGDAAAALTGTQPVFSIRKARSRLGWEPRRSWRTELRDRPEGVPGADWPETGSHPDHAAEPAPPAHPAQPASAPLTQIGTR